MTLNIWCPGQDEIRKGGANTLEITEAKTGHVSVKFGGLNSVLPCCSVEGRASVDINGGRTKVHLEGDNYPDFEAYRYTSGPLATTLADDDTPGHGMQSFPQWWSDRDVTFIDGVRQ